VPRLVARKTDMNSTVRAKHNLREGAICHAAALHVLVHLVAGVAWCGDVRGWKMQVATIQTAAAFCDETIRNGHHCALAFPLVLAWGVRLAAGVACGAPVVVCNKFCGRGGVSGAWHRGRGALGWAVLFYVGHVGP